MHECYTDIHSIMEGNLIWTGGKTKFQKKDAIRPPTATRDDTPHGDPHATVTHPAYSGTFRGRRIYVFACTVHFVLRKILPCERRKELWIGKKLMKGAYLWLVMFSFDECIGQWRILSFHKRCSLLNFSTSEVKNVLELKWTCDQR